MKTNHVSRSFSEIDQAQKRFTFGDLIVSIYDACGKDRANGILRLALNAHLIQFGGSQRITISNQTKGSELELMKLQQGAAFGAADEPLNTHVKFSTF